MFAKRLGVSKFHILGDSAYYWLALANLSLLQIHASGGSEGPKSAEENFNYTLRPTLKLTLPKASSEVVKTHLSTMWNSLPAKLQEHFEPQRFVPTVSASALTSSA